MNQLIDIGVDVNLLDSDDDNDDDNDDNNDDDNTNYNVDNEIYIQSKKRRNQPYNQNGLMKKRRVITEVQKTKLKTFIAKIASHYSMTYSALCNDNGNNIGSSRFNWSLFNNIVKSQRNAIMKSKLCLHSSSSPYTSKSSSNSFSNFTENSNMKTTRVYQTEPLLCSIKRNDDPFHDDSLKIDEIIDLMFSESLHSLSTKLPIIRGYIINTLSLSVFKPNDFFEKLIQKTIYGKCKEDEHKENEHYENNDCHH